MSCWGIGLVPEEIAENPDKRSVKTMGALKSE